MFTPKCFENVAYSANVGVVSGDHTSKNDIAAATG